MNEEISKLANKVIQLAHEKHVSIATAESCTGGGIGAALTAISGASSVFKGGIIAYSNAVKNSHLNVPPAMLHKYGAVSRHVASTMAASARENLNTDIAVSVTGIAGPGGGSADKPVGTVWFGLAQKGEVTCTTHCLFNDKDREGVRQAAIVKALSLILQAL